MSSITNINKITGFISDTDLDSKLKDMSQYLYWFMEQQIFRDGFKSVIAAKWDFRCGKIQTLGELLKPFGGAPLNCLF